MQNQGSLLRCEMTYLKQYLRQHGAQKWLHCLSALDTYREPTMPLSEYSLTDLPCHPFPGPLTTLLRPFSQFYTYPFVQPLALLDPSRVYTSLCAQHCAEYLTPHSCGTCVCQLISPGVRKYLSGTSGNEKEVKLSKRLWRKWKLK